MRAPIVSLRVGMPRDVSASGSGAWWDSAWRSSSWKSPVATPCALTPLGFAGDGVADPRVHGGVDKAACCYAAAHYPWWRARLGDVVVEDDVFGPGAFGENLCFDEIEERDVCVGDRCRLGSALVEVSQPRSPCWKLARRWRIKDLTAQVDHSGRTGFYLRVLEPGVVDPHDVLELLERPFPALTIAHANDVMTGRDDSPAALRRLAACPALSAAWRDDLRHQLSSS